MNLQKFMEFYLNHKGGIIGSVIGVIIAILILTINLWKTLFIAFLGILGYYIGASIFSGSSLLKAIIDKLLPPGKMR